MGESNTPEKKTVYQNFYKLILHSLASLLLFYSGYFLPIGGMFVLLFSPSPLALLGIRSGHRLMLAGILLTSFGLFFFDLWLALYFFIGQGLLCIGLVYPHNKVKNGSEALLLCTIISTVSKIIFLAIAIGFTGQNPFMPDQLTMREVLNQMYASMLAQGGGDAASLKESIEQIVAFLPYMLPTVILFSSMLDSFVNYKLCGYLLKKSQITFLPLSPLGEWHFPKSLIWALCLAFILPFLTGESESPLWFMLETNLKFLVSVFFFLQGISVAWWWMARRQLKMIFKVILVILLSLPFFAMWVTALGLGDMAFELRTRLEKRE